MKPFSPKMPSALLSVDQLGVDIPSRQGLVHAVGGVSFCLEKGKTLGIVGESGCGKTILCRAIMNLLPKGSRISKGSRILFNGLDLTGLSPRTMNRIRGRDIGMVFQDSMTSLNPVRTVGSQIAESLVHHLGMPAGEALKQAVDLMGSSGIPRPELRCRQYPHQLSGGLRQRVAIAMALSCRPKLLIADEPTTALDVTVQAGILDLLDHLRQTRNMAMILVTHDLGVAAQRCQDIGVMYAGKLVEKASAKDLFSHMKMPYTRALFDSLPRLENPVHTTLKTIEGSPPDLVSPEKGCRFSPRCQVGTSRCRQHAPKLCAPDGCSHQVACWHPLARQRTTNQLPPSAALNNGRQPHGN